MTDETKKARVAIENIVRAVCGGGAEIDHRVLLDGLSEYIHIDSPLTEDERPELDAARHLALSVLVGDPNVPVSVLLGALEDSGVWPSGAAAEIAERAREEGYEQGLKDGNPFNAVASTLASGVEEFGRAVYRAHNPTTTVTISPAPQLSVGPLVDITWTTPQAEWVARLLNAAWGDDAFTPQADGTIVFYDGFDVHDDEEPHDAAFRVSLDAQEVCERHLPVGWRRYDFWSDNDSCGFTIAPPT